MTSELAENQKPGRYGSATGLNIESKFRSCFFFSFLQETLFTLCELQICIILCFILFCILLYFGRLPWHHFVWEVWVIEMILTLILLWNC